jgi:hypothetical protein
VGRQCVCRWSIDQFCVVFCELFVHWDAFWLEAAPASV